MDLERKKADIIGLINEVKDIEFLEEIGLIIKERSESFVWDELPNDLKSRIEDSREELKKGEGTSHEEVMKGYQ